MAKVKYDVTNVEEGPDRSKVKPGMYAGKILEVTDRESRNGNQMLEIVLELTGPAKEAKGVKLWHYVVTDDESSAFRVKELVEAVGMRLKGTLDTDKIVGKTVQVRVRGGKDLDDAYRPEVGKLLPPKDAEPDEDEDEDEEQDFSEMSLAELKEAAEEAGIEVEGKVTKAKLLAALEDDSEPDEEEDDETKEDDETDLDELDRKELKAYIKSQSLDVRVTRGMDDDDVRAAIIEAEQGDEDETWNPDYASWEIQKLKDELEKRELRTSGKKNILVSRLEKDDESGDEPF